MVFNNAPCLPWPQLLLIPRFPFQSRWPYKPCSHTPNIPTSPQCTNIHTGLARFCFLVTSHASVSPLNQTTFIFSGDFARDFTRTHNTSVNVFAIWFLVYICESFYRHVDPSGIGELQGMYIINLTRHCSNVVQSGRVYTISRV